MLKTPANGIIRGQINVLGRGAVNTHQALSLSGGSALGKYIPLTQGYRALVDDDRYEELAQYNWCAQIAGNCVYAVRGSGPRNDFQWHAMHRVILGLADDDSRVSDHINGDTLDNRRVNLRSCTRGQNNTNVPVRKDSTHGFKGLMIDKRRGRFTSIVMSQGERHWVGSSDNPIELALARDIVAYRVQGEFAWLNFPREIIVALDEALSATEAP